jgi:hypothetical protein
MHRVALFRWLRTSGLDQQLLLLRDEAVIEHWISTRGTLARPRVCFAFGASLYPGATGTACPAAPRAANFEEFYECQASD